MGEVKDTVKGSGPKPSKKATKKAEGNLINQVIDLMDEVGRLTVIKDDDTLSEGDAAFADNTRKAATLRAAHSLLTATRTLLEEY